MKNKEKKRISWITSGSNKAVAVENDTGTDDLEKESRMKGIMKQEVHGVKIHSTEHDPLSMETLDGALGDEKLEQLDSQTEKLLFTKNTPKHLHAMQKIYKRVPKLLMYWIKHTIICRTPILQRVTKHT